MTQNNQQVHIDAANLVLDILGIKAHAREAEVGPWGKGLIVQLDPTVSLDRDGGYAGGGNFYAIIRDRIAAHRRFGNVLSLKIMPTFDSEKFGIFLTAIGVWHGTKPEVTPVWQEKTYKVRVQTAAGVFEGDFLDVLESLLDEEFER